MLELGAAGIAAIALSPDEVRAAVEAAYAARSRGAALAPGKLVLDPGSGRTVQAMAAALPEAGLAGVKWVSVVPAGASPGPAVRAAILLTDLGSGEMLALLDGAWITAARTAAMSAIAAQRLARPSSRRLAFVGCGVQAVSHLEALPRVLPALHEVVACSRNRASAEALAARAGAAGLAPRVELDPRRAVAGADIVVTSVPAAPGLAPFLDPDWFAPDSFVAAVDLGRSIEREGIDRFAVLATDDRGQSEALARAGKLVTAGPFLADLADLCGPRPPQAAGRGPTLFAFAGHGLADLAVAAALLAEARARGLARELRD